LLASLSYIYLQNQIKISHFKILVFFFLLFNFTLFFFHPVISNDIYIYISQGRLISHGQINPYFHPYADFQNDPLFGQINTPWANNHTSVYGPIFLLVSTLITWLGGNSFIITLFLFKAAFIILNIACAYLVLKISADIKMFFLYAWNPLILFEFAANGHNDVITIFFVLISILFLFKNKEKNQKYFLLSYFFLLLSVLIKYITLPLLPIFIIVTSQFYRNRNEKLFYWLKISIVTLLVFFASFFFFWQGTNLFSGLKYYAIGGQDSIFWCPFIIILHFLSYNWPLFKNLSFIYLVSKSIFIFFYLTLLYTIIKHKVDKPTSPIIQYFSIAILIFYFFFFTWLVPWYFALLITLLILNYGFNKSKVSLIAANIFLFYGILYYLFLR